MKFQRNPLFFSKLIEGKWVLLEQNSAYCYNLNETAGFLWDNLNKPKFLNDLIELIMDNYKTKKDQVSKDVNIFLKNGLKRGFIVLKK